MANLTLLLALVDDAFALWGTALLAGLAASGRLHALALGLGGLAFALAWGTWAAPVSPRRLEGRPLAVFKTGAFAVGTLGFALTGQSGTAWTLALTAALTLLPPEAMLARLRRWRGD
ncbi:DUF2568 domain-containing protein [Rubellimicrobium arenae]|uniref:DUF2568 domain-containing protein n=1 Tax=Rubellimicrobium arenae TaxID=2817372 RepID=UPI001B30ECE2|nr:DUF2568 domain-containing protein [Rubellimicrobium arenae]